MYTVLLYQVGNTDYEIFFCCMMFRQQYALTNSPTCIKDNFKIHVF